MSKQLTDAEIWPKLFKDLRRAHGFRPQTDAEIQAELEAVEPADISEATIKEMARAIAAKGREVQP